ASSSWRTMDHLGRPGKRLARDVLATFTATKTQKLRIANITNGPSFTEVEVYAAPGPSELHVATDLDGRLIGALTDRFGSRPVAGADVRLTGEASSRPFTRAGKTDQRGLWFLELPLGIRGELELRAEWENGSVITRVDAVTLQTALTPRDVEPAG